MNDKVECPECKSDKHLCMITNMWKIVDGEEVCPYECEKCNLIFYPDEMTKISAVRNSREIDKKEIISKEEYLVLLHDKEVRNQERTQFRKEVLEIIDERVTSAEKETPENVKVMILKKLQKEIEPQEVLEFCKFVIAEELKALKKRIEEIS